MCRAHGCGPEAFAWDNLEDVCLIRALSQCYPKGRARAVEDLPRFLQEHPFTAKISEVAGTVQVHGVAATAYLICG